MIGRKGLVGVALVVLCLAAYFPFVPARFGDFRAFYCSGRAVIAHADPYREHPLHDCERSVQAPGVSRLNNDVAIPAPFPGYALALFALISLLPFGLAAGLWLLASLAALASSIVLVARCLDIRLAAVVIAIGFPTIAAAIRIGQATPFVALAMALTAYLLVRDKPRSAAFVALGIALEPHIALAIFAALFIGDRRTRIPLLLGGLALSGVSVLVLGVPLNVEYVHDVLPAHALANVPDLAQFSVAHFAYLAGMDPEHARSAGSAWYAVAATIGIVVALRLRSRYGLAALVFIPPAFEVFGGVYVHITQLALALPAFFLLLQASSRFRPALVAAIFFAAIPWFMIVNFPMLIPAITILGIGFAIVMDVEGLAFPLAIAASIVALVLFRTSFIGAADHAPLPVIVHPAGNPLADVSWGVAMLERDGFARVAWFIAAKTPTLAAFAILLTALAAAAVNVTPTQWPNPSVLRNRKVRDPLADR